VTGVAAICVFCASSELIAPSYLALAEQVGARLAAGGHSLVYGGGRVSMMGGVARAARTGGASVFGVIPRGLIAEEDADPAEVAVVGSMRERKLLMDDRADGFLALPGGLGTFDELLEVWTTASLGMHRKPVVVLDADGFYGPLWRYLDDLAGRGFVRASALAAIERVGSVDAAFTALERRLASRTRSGAQ
jgi:uncharacterized protein (TIGR00730 family)